MFSTFKQHTKKCYNLWMFHSLGKTILQSVEELGNITLLCWDSSKKIWSTFNLKKRTLEQFILLGLMSIPMTVVTSAFVGMAFTLQVSKEFIKFGAGEMIGGIVGMALWRELSPLITGVVFSGRVGAAISAELASMKVTEQVDALESLSQSPIKYLVIPRLIACTLALPLLVGLSDIVGFLSGFVIAITEGGINPYAYFGSAEAMLTINDITGGLIKAVVFGFSIAAISCYKGLTAQGGAKGVGLVTTRAVVVSLVAVFILNYFLSELLY
jgi:phospholipid/cholesterol/gamma-HCH transport system permease protein